jgi:hypothetical protein
MSPRTKTALRVIFGGLILAWGVGQLHVIPKHRPP